MVTSANIKGQVDRIWDIFYSNGVNNPLTAIEQITYLLFIRGLDELQKKKEAFANEMSMVTGVKYEVENSIFAEEQQKYRWSYLKNMSDTNELFRLVRDEVFPFMGTLGQTEGENGASKGIGRYLNNTFLVIQEPSALSRIIEEIDELLNTLEVLDYHQDGTEADTLGDLYEYLLLKIQTAGRNGQFRTPAHIRNMMVELMQPTPDDRIADPSCGTAGFLISAFNYIMKHNRDLFTNPDKETQRKRFYNDLFYGFDNDITMVRIAAMNLYLHGIEEPNIEYKNSLSKANDASSQYTLVIANPPFTGTIDGEVIAEDLKEMVPLTQSTKKGKNGEPAKKISQAKTELLFLALILRQLRTGGRAAVIVPDGVLFGSSKAHIAVRKEIINNHKLEAVISMPSGVFKPYAGVSTAVLIFTKTGTGGTKDVWFYNMKSDGYTLNDKRDQIEENDIPDIISRFHNLEGEKERDRTEPSFLVPLEEIKEKSLNLNFNRYKKSVQERVEYKNPKDILTEIDTLVHDIARGIKVLEGMIK